MNGKLQEVVIIPMKSYQRQPVPQSLQNCRQISAGIHCEDRNVKLFIFFPLKFFFFFIFSSHGWDFFCMNFYLKFVFTSALSFVNAITTSDKNENYRTRKKKVQQKTSPIATRLKRTRKNYTKFAFLQFTSHFHLLFCAFPFVVSKNG